MVNRSWPSCVCIGEQAGQWIATAKRDSHGQFHVAKADDEDEAVTTLAKMVDVGWATFDEDLPCE